MVKQRVINVVAASLEVKPESISVSDSFEELGVDSLLALTVIHEIEEEFGVMIPSQSAIDLDSVSDLIDKLEEFLNSSQ